jgi:RNA polymerase sigma factor (sigma-70 family)
LKTDDVAQLRLLLAAVARKDADAFGQLYRVTSAKLFAFSLRILFKKELAEEALQEAFISIWNNAAGYNESFAAPMTWMVTVTRNKAFDILRRQGGGTYSVEALDQDLLDTLASDDPTPPQQMEQDEEAKALARCMDRLEKLHRQAIALAWYQDLSHTEVAQQMQLPVGTVKTWIRRGMDKLRGCLLERERG